MFTFVYVRGNKTIKVSNAGMALYDNTTGTLLSPTAASTPLDDAAVAGIVADLLTSGWAPVE